MQNDYEKARIASEGRIHAIREFGVTAHVFAATPEEYLEAQRRGIRGGNNVIVKKLRNVDRWFHLLKAHVRQDVWNGKPPFRFIEIGRRVCV